MHRIDQMLTLVAQDQWGTFSDRQAKSFGASRTFISRRVRGKDWVRFAEGALGFPDWPPSYERSLWAALHAGHCFDLLVPHGTTHRNPIAIVTQTRHMPKLVRFNGFPMPSRERVLCEVARKVGPIRLGIALDDQLVKRTISLARTQRTFLELARPGWPGLSTMASVLSPGEATNTCRRAPSSTGNSD